MTNAVSMEWRVCPRFPHLEISECGDLRFVLAGPKRPKGYRFKGFIDADGYIRYSWKLNGDMFVIAAHRLVAEAFIGPCPSEKHEVAHNNGSRVSCDYRNLRWATRLENADDTRTHDTIQAGERNGRAKITEDDVHFIRVEYRRVKNERIKGGLIALEKRFDLHRATIIGIAKGASWRHLPFRPEHQPESPFA